MITTRFTFYKATISHKYFDSLASGFPTDHITIIRYPHKPDDSKSPPSELDYLIPSERELIIDFLLRLREQIKRKSG